MEIWLYVSAILKSTYKSLLDNSSIHVKDFMNDLQLWYRIFLAN